MAFRAGHAGVDLFFVISGFIILFVHGSDIGRPARLAHYVGRRCNRVLPLYWAALSLTVALSVAGGHPAPSLLEALWSALLLPSYGEPLLGIAWTLQNEMLFYALFTLLIVNRQVGTAMFGIWLACILAAGFRPLLPSPLGGTYGLEFFFGMAAAHALRCWPVPVPRFLACAGAAFFVACMVLESAGELDGYGLAGRIAYGLAAMVLVLGVAASDQARALAVPGWLSRLGGASYSIYLFQFVFIGLAWQAWLKAGLGDAGAGIGLFMLLASVALAGGVAISTLVERPLLALMQRKVGGSGRLAGAAWRMRYDPKA